jgi:DNA (cytosine-5)-methyltransferase 1
LLISFARLVIELQPKYFVVENVRGLFLGEARKKLHGFCQKVEKAGYKVIKPIKLLNAMDMGVPQSRVRVIILGYKNGNKPPLYPRENNKRKVSVWDALGDLPNIQNLDYLYRSDIYNGKLKKPLSLYSEILRGESDDLDDKSLPRENVGKGLSGFKKTKHTKTTIQRFSITNPGETEKVSHFFRLPKDDVARTLRAGSPKSHGGYTAPRPIHPEHPRCITVREGARLHSFPDWFDFHPTIWHGFRQLGNSVPPLLARSVAKEIYKLF